MPKGYIAGSIDVTDPLAYGEYAIASKLALATHEGTALVRGGPQQPLGGQPGGRTVDASETG